MALFKTVGDVLGDIAQNVPPCVQFVDFALVGIFVHAEKKGDMGLVVSQPEPDHFGGIVVAINAIRNWELAHILTHLTCDHPTRTSGDYRVGMGSSMTELSIPQQHRANSVA